MPKNLITRKDYRGVNLFLLNSMSYSFPYWLTFKQVVESGGYVRKGESPTVVIFWKWLKKTEMDVSDEEETQKARSLC